MRKHASEVKSPSTLQGNTRFLRKSKNPALTPEAKKSKGKAPSWVSVDYPRPDEKIKKGHYAVRIHAPWAAQAQIAIGGVSWKECRSDVGFFWYDWYPEHSGSHVINARARNGAGAWTKAETRECEVE